MHGLKDINWNHLYYFYEVAKSHSLKNAALSIKVAPSTLSEQLKKLEGSLGKKLFHRSTKKLSLTTDGALLFERTKKIFEEGSKVLEHFSDDIVGGYSVSVGIEEALGDDIPCEFASQYWDLYANYGTVKTVRQFSHESLLDNLIKGNIDWAISAKPPKRKSLSFDKIGTFKIFFCCSKELFKKFKDPKDILNYIPFFESNRDKSLNKFVANYLRKKNIFPKEKISNDHFEFAYKLCERGRCVMFMAQNPLVTQSSLKMFTLDDDLEINVYAVWRKNDEALISIQTLKKLIYSRFDQLPLSYRDVNLQIEVSQVDKNLLKKIVK